MKANAMLDRGDPDGACGGPRRGHGHRTQGRLAVVHDGVLAVQLPASAWCFRVRRSVQFQPAMPPSRVEMVSVRMVIR